MSQLIRGHTCTLCDPTGFFFSFVNERWCGIVGIECEVAGRAEVGLARVNSQLRNKSLSTLFHTSDFSNFTLSLWKPGGYTKSILFFRRNSSVSCYGPMYLRRRRSSDKRQHSSALCCGCRQWIGRAPHSAASLLYVNVCREARVAYH